MREHAYRAQEAEIKMRVSKSKSPSGTAVSGSMPMPHEVGTASDYGALVGKHLKLGFEARKGSQQDIRWNFCEVMQFNKKDGKLLLK